MKKILLLLSTVLTCVSAWAQESVYKLGEPTTNLSSGKYALVCKSEKGVGAAYYHSEGNGRNYRYDLSKSDATTGSLLDGNYVWVVDVLENGKITIKWANDQTKFFPKDAARNSNFSGTEIAELTPEVKTIGGKDYIALKYDDTIGWIHVNSPGGNPNFSYWTAYGDEGTCVKFLFHPVTEINTVELTYTLTDEVGNVYAGTYTGVKGSSEPVLSGVAGYTFGNKEWDGNKFTATINFPFPVSKDGGVTNATMISNFNANQRWHAVGTDVKVQTMDVEPAYINEWLWAIYPSFADGKFTFVVKNMSTGTYLFTDKTANSFDTQGTVVLKEAGTPLEVISWLNSPCFTVSGKTLYLTINGSADTDVYLATYVGGNNNHGGNKLYFPSYAVVSLNEAGYASTYLPFDAALCEGLEAYAVTATSATKATLTALQGIKANQGAILKGVASTEYVLAAANVASDWSGNLLKGSVTDTEVAGEGYVLASKDGVTAFYKAKLTDGKFKNNAGKAYLPASAVPAGARFLSFDFGTETAIDELKGENGNVKTVIYDLSGRRVQGAQKGIYVVNGKVVIK